MKQCLWKASIVIVLMTGVCSASPTEQFKQIECHAQPMDLMPKGNPRARKYKSRPLSLHHAPFKLSASINWSGYVVAKNIQHPKEKVVTKVVGSWRVPTLTATPDDSISSAWVGIDGFATNSQTVEQIGTIQLFLGGIQTNLAFFEFFPGPAFELVGFPVNNNDLIRGKVHYEGDHVFKLVLINKTQKVFAVIKQKFKGTERSSAQWISEAPSDGQGNLFPLANFGRINFSECKATLDDQHGSISDPHWNYDAVWMVGLTNDVTPLIFLKSQPSALSKDGESFRLTWRHE